MNLNKEQKEAIESKVGRNLLISAGAGSGKTSVLTKRVIKILKSGDAKLSELLILTFTNAAALEMKVRIKKALSEVEDLKDLVPLVDSAHIETYDAYRMFLVKKYGHSIGLSEDINVLDYDIFSVKKREFIEEVLNEEYEKDAKELHDIVKLYLDRTDEDLIKFISRIIDEVPYLDKEFIKKYEQEKLSDEFFKQFEKDLFFKIQDLAKEAFDVAPDENNSIIKFKKCLKEITDYSSLKELFDAGNLFYDGQVRTTDEEAKTTIKNNRKEIQNYLDDINLDFLYKYDVPYHQKLIPYVLKLSLKASEKLNEFKKVNGYFTFNDISLFANKILNENPNYREEIKHSFKEIMIDEYQDTSDLDEEFINLISNNNVFCVGDIKQSIYLFRGAQPENFKKRSDQYRKDKTCKLIAMNDNYRSRKEVIDFINRLFSMVMTKKSSSIQYEPSEKLTAANIGLNSKKSPKQEYGFFSLTYKKSDDIDINETEAKLMAEDILKRIQNKEKVISGDTLKDIEYKDIAILVEKKTKLDKIEEVFKEYGIPLTIYTTDNLLVNDVILTIISLLNFVYEYQNNKKQDILKRYFVSIARSFLFEYKDQKIYEMIKSNTYRKDELYIKLTKFADDNKNLLISKLFSNLLESFDFFEKVGKFKDPIKEVNILNLLYGKTKQLDQLQYTLEQFVLYLKELNELDLTIEVNKSASSDNAVQLMTIHKSKGLQFNVVYFPQMEERKMVDNQSYKVSSKYGFWFPFYSNKTSQSSYIYKFYDDRKKLEEQEDIRKFYVALTRVIEVGVFILPISESGKHNTGLGKYLKDVALAPSPLEKIKTVQKIIKQEIPKEKPIEFKKLKTQFVEDTTLHIASKPIDEDVDEELLRYGTHLHLLMEAVDFNTKDLSFIKDDKNKKIIQEVLKLPVFKNLEGVNIYKEYQFYDLKNNKTGVIDLMLVYNNHIKIIDYKTKKIDDDAYVQQLNTYKTYIEGVFKLNVECYLLSLVDADLKQIL